MSAAERQRWRDAWLDAWPFMVQLLLEPIAARWQRRLEGGETAEQVAAAPGLSPTEVRQIARIWDLYTTMRQVDTAQPGGLPPG